MLNSNSIYSFPCVFYYESHSIEEEMSQIYVCFPDLLKIDLPASTLAHSREEAIEKSEKMLAVMLRVARDKGMRLPFPTPLDQVKIYRGTDLKMKPLRIEILNISNRALVLSEGKIIEGKIEGDRYLINSIAGEPVQKNAYTSDKIYSLYRRIKGEPISLKFGSQRITLNAEQALQMRQELRDIATMLDK